MMRMTIVALLLSFATAHATECKSDLECAAPTRCVAIGKKKLCAQSCDPKAPICPENTRCVKDSPSYVCRPITDGLDR